MVTILMVAVAMTIVLAGYLFPSGLAADDAMMAGQPNTMSSDGAAAIFPEYARYDAGSIDSRVQAAVIKALMIYQAEGPAAFEMITPEEALITDTIYPFVLDAETLETVAQGAFPDPAGVIADTLIQADSPVERILADLERDGGTWVEYMATNPANGIIQPKRSWLYLHDGYIFGSGHYLSESEVRYVVEDAVRLYESKGQEAFEIITPEETLLVTELYPFIFNSTTLKTVAHGAIPDRLGHVPYSILNTGDRPVEEILADLERDGGTWVEYVFTNPATETKQLKRSWLYLYDGYIFSSGYYLQDSRAQSLVAEAIILYKANGEGAFDIITPEVADPLSLQSSFVLDATNLKVVAHGLLPDLVGSTDQHLVAADRSLERIIDEMRSADGIWVWYMAQNHATLTDQLTRTYLSLHDGYIFGASYSLPDSRIQSVVDESIYTYRNDPDSGFEVMTSGMLNRLGSYPLVRNATHILAHGTLPHLVGPYPDITGARSTVNAINAAAASGGTVWQQVVFVSPYTGTDQIKRSWATLYDGYLFISNYNVPDADTQSVVDYATFIYESNKENDAWIDIITPDEYVITDDLYPFVIDAASWTRLADGVVPDRVGKAETILDTSTRSVEDVLADLEANGSVWVTYTFHNPSTGIEQLKRTYLQMRDGLVFGSGYYLLDSQVQSIAYAKTLDYDRKGRDATFAGINAIPEQPVTTYVFVADPVTGMIHAQNVNPDLIGSTSDWNAINSDLSVDDILETADAEGGVWASYTFTNPVTGEMDSKRTWLIIHDGLVFGSGYYSSDIPQADVRFVVDSTIFTYESNKENDAWIDIITPDEPLMTDDLYPFVINATSWTRLADGVVPDRVGKAETILDTSDRSVEDVLADLEIDGSVWVTYTFHNPSTDTEQLKHTYLELHDGLVFGSGYYLLDSQVQAATYGQILEYNNKGKDAAFADLNTIPEQPVPTYVFVADPATGIIQAQNVNPDLIGSTSDWDAISSNLPVDDILNEIRRGTGMWVSYHLINPMTGETEDKRTWLIMHDGLVFGSGYYSSSMELASSETVEITNSDDGGSDPVMADIKDRFITTWETRSPGDSITIPVGGATGKYLVDWGDGDITIHEGDATHTYDTPGTYTVQVSGDFTRISLGDDPRSASKLRSITQWGSIQWTTMESAFEGATGMTYEASDAPDLSRVTDLSFMFFRASSFNGDLSNWDVSTVTDMSYMFTYATPFNGNVSNWDVSSVTDMFIMFSGTAFNQDISSWDVSSVTDMARMFNHATAFNQDIGSWDVSSVTDMNNMFDGAASFNQDISSWDVSSVTDMGQMFQKTTFFNQDISSWDVSSVTDMNNMFDGAASFNQDISSWDVSSVINMRQMFLNAASFNQDLDNWDVSSVTDMSAMFAHATFFNGNVSNWDVSSVTDMNHMFSLTSFFRGDISRWDVSSVTDMNHMFAHSAFNGNISSWDVSSVTDMSYMFLSADDFNGNISSWDVSSVTDMSSMFWFAASFNQDIGSWDVSSVTDMARMFNHATAFNQDIGSWDVSSVRDMTRIFDFAYSFDHALDGWDVISDDG